MKRLYFLTKSLDSVTQISDDLHREGLSDWHIHVVSKDEAGLYHRHVHSANIFQQNDVIHSGEMGAMLGAMTGLLIALIADVWLPAEFDISTLTLGILTGVFTLFGAWSGGLAGVTRENYRLQRFHDDLENGAYLIMVDLHKPQELQVKQQIARYHPEALLAAQGSSLIQPFSYNFWFPPKKA